MKKKLAVIALGTMFLVGCAEDIVTGPVIVPRSTEGDIRPVVSSLSPIKNIYVEFQNKFEVGTAAMPFEPKGIIAGKESPMIPLSDRQSDLQSLGFVTYISNDGNEATLTYNDSILNFKVEDESLYLNDSLGTIIVDKPFYNNGTIYVPIIPILEVLKIDYEVAGTDLIIGGVYTDDTGEPANINQQPNEGGVSGTTDSSSNGATDNTSTGGISSGAGSESGN